ncbi:MAG: AzlC family ABC transporter permease [Carnobacterium sp.]|uniref:AzlC family ABC transporter permease n=2 Tax=Carnobacterium sp. TaxID=48221 RepID=UPI002FCBEAE3
MERQVWQAGFKSIYPVLIGYIPLGMACGMLLYDAGFSIPAIFLMSLLVFAGASQFMAASMVVMGVTAPAIITMVFFLNLRHSLMSSSMSRYVKKSSVPFILLFSHTLADEAYAVNYNQFQNHDWTAQKALAANLWAYLTWSISTAIGGWIGSTLAINTTIMNYVLIAMFIYLLANQLVSKLVVFVGLFSGVVSIILMVVLKHNIALVIAAILASFVGYFADSYLTKKKTKEKGWAQ